MPSLRGSATVLRHSACERQRKRRMGVLGFFIPLVGFILWLAWMDNKPKCSRMAGIGVLCFIVAIVVFMASLMIMLG